LSPANILKHDRMILAVRESRDQPAREAIVVQWCREQIRYVPPELVPKWKLIRGVKVERCLVQQMKTRWGSCNSRARSVCLNTELAKEPKECPSGSSTDND